MIRFQRIGDRTYRVIRNYERIGCVTEPVVGRGWRYTTETSLTVETTDAGTFRVRGTSAAYYSAEEALNHATRHAGRTRTEAVRALLEANDLDASEYSPVSRAGRSRRAGSANSAGRAFGVELELTGPDASAIIGALQNAGVRVRSILSYRATDGNDWELKSDGSVGGQGLELVSPKLRGEAGFAELRTVCQALQSVGATVNRTCGLHVHHDMRGLQADSIKRQVLAFVDRQHLIRQLVAPSRRHNPYCPEWGASSAQQLRDFRVSSYQSLSQIAYIGPRGVINLQAYARHGSVEVRYHGGSTNFTKIAAWVRFSQALFAMAERDGDGFRLAADDTRTMVTELVNANLGFTGVDANAVLRFLTAAEAAEAQVEESEEATV